MSQRWKKMHYRFCHRNLMISWNFVTEALNHELCNKFHSFVALSWSQTTIFIICQQNMGATSVVDMFFYCLWKLNIKINTIRKRQFHLMYLACDHITIVPIFYIDVNKKTCAVAIMFNYQIKFIWMNGCAQIVSQFHFWCIPIGVENAFACKILVLFQCNNFD